MRLRKYEKGWYLVELDGHEWSIVNMQGQSIRWSGPGAHWEIRLGGEGPHRIGAKSVHTAWTRAEAVEWLSEPENRKRALR